MTLARWPNIDAPEAGHDFTLRKDARLLKELPAFEPIPFHRIGLYQDACRRTLPPHTAAAHCRRTLPPR